MFGFQLRVSDFWIEKHLFLGLGVARGPGGNQGNQKRKHYFRSCVVDVYVGNKSALFDHLSLSIDASGGMSS